MEKLAPLPVLLLILAGCSTPSVNLSTPDPIKVDIAMRLDVYQHAPPAGDKKPAAKPVAESTGGGDPQERRRNRMADIQQFKNSRIVGEGRDGLVVIRVETPGDYGDYIRKVVAEENRDRMTLMKATAEKEKISLPEVQNRQASVWQKMAFKDEWIEVPDKSGGWKWVQKEG